MNPTRIHPSAYKVSIALCTYNGEKFLSEQLQSYLEQTRQPDELVVCDDCSVDRTVKIVEDFRLAAPFDIRIYLREENVGYVKNFEQALLKCTGDIIFPSDQDDVWNRDKIETILAAFTQQPETLMFVTNGELVDSCLKRLPGSLLQSLGVDRERIDSLEENALETLLFGTNFVSGNTVAVRSELARWLLQYPAPPGSAHDHWLAVIAFLESGLRILDFNSIKYRQHPGQVFGTGLYPRKTPPDPGRFIRLIQIANDQRRSYMDLLEFLEATGDRSRRSENNKKLLSRKVVDLDDRMAHSSVRGNLERNRLRRALQIVKELRKGRYHQCSRGYKTAVFDLFRR
jgi:glycosyltransferase involved in cell wall biosynthesis